jgi:hypothetical protein
VSARRPPKLKRLAQVAKDAEAARAARRQADDLTADGFPVGHPLRTFCLLASGDAGRAQYVFEQTQEFLRKKT